MANPIELQWGRIEFGMNEMTIVSTVDDPPGLRLAAAHGGSIGKTSWNRLRSDGVQEEVVLLQGKIDERYRSDPNSLAGEVTLHIRRPGVDGDAAMVHVATFRSDGVTFHVPANVGSSVSPTPEMLRSADGRFRLIAQNDGNVVLYYGDRPLWATNTVMG